MTSMMDYMKGGFEGIQGTVSGLQGQLSGVAGQMTGLTAELMQFKQETNTKFQTIDEHLKLHADQIKSLQAAPVPSTSVSTTPLDFGASPQSTDFIPKNRRKIVVVRGFPYDTLSGDIVDELRTMVGPNTTIVNITAPGKLASIGKIIFKDSGSMWAFLVAMKGKKLKSTKFPNAAFTHSIDQTVPERLMGKQTSHMVNSLRTFALEKRLINEEAMKKAIDGDWDRGYCYAKLGDEPVIRLIEWDKNTSAYVVCAGATNLGWDFDWAQLALDTTNVTLGR